MSNDVVNEMFYEQVTTLLRESYLDLVEVNDIDLMEFYEDGMSAEEVANSVMNAIDQDVFRSEVE